MLVNLCHSLDATAGPLAAAAVRRHLVESMPLFPDRFLHVVGLAFAEAASGSPEAARAHLDEIDPASTPAYYRVVYHLTKMLLAARDGTPDPVGAMVGELTLALDTWPGWRSDPGLKNHVNAAIGAASRGPAGRTAAGKLKWAARRHGAIFGIPWTSDRPVLVVLLAVLAIYAGARLLAWFSG
jgi:hypothetical protein